MTRHRAVSLALIVWLSLVASAIEEGLAQRSRVGPPKSSANFCPIAQERTGVARSKLVEKGKGEKAFWEFGQGNEPTVEKTFFVVGERCRARHDHSESEHIHGNPGLRPRACVILPEKRAFRNVFGQEPTGKESKDLENYRGHFRKEGIVVVGEASAGESALKKQVEELAEQGAWPVVIIGHSEFSKSGEQVLFMPTGAQVPIVEVHRWAAEAGAPCLVLTCFGRDFGLLQKISYEDALAMWRGTMRAVHDASRLEDRETPIDTSVVTNGNASLENFVHKMTLARSKRGARRMSITASAPPGKSLATTSIRPGQVVVLRLNMERPDRNIWILAMLVSGFAVVHYVIWRKGHSPFVSSPTNLESFRDAMIKAFQREQFSRRLGIELAGFVLLVAASAYVLGTELAMDFLEGRDGGRWLVHVASWFSVLSSLLACTICLTCPSRTWLGAFSHGFGGIIAGGCTAWFCGTVHYLRVYFYFGLGGALLASLGGPGPGYGFLYGALLAIGGAQFVAALLAIAGSSRGWKLAVLGAPVHEEVWKMTTEDLEDLDAPLSRSSES